MAIDIDEPDSPGWWLSKCAKKLEKRHPRLELLNSYVEGDAPIPNDADPAVADAYKRFRRQARTNFAELIVLALRRRIKITGFRTAADMSRTGDQVVEQLWDRNGMAIELPDVIESMVGLADGYTMLGRLDVDGQPGPVVITGEDPRQVVTIHDPVQQRIVRAGLKLYHDDDEDLDIAYLHRPGTVYRAVRKRKATAVTAKRVPRFSSSSWDWDDDAGGEAGLETGISRVPIVRFRNRKGVGIFENHLDLLERLDQQQFRGDVIAAIQAFRQRAAIGTPDEDDDGNPIDWDDILAADPGAFWRLPEGAEMWESAITDVRPLTEQKKASIQELCAVTSTPMHVFFPDAASGSAEGASLMREEHVAAAEDVLDRVVESVKDTVAIAFELQGDQVRSQRENITVLSRPVERRSLAEVADANSKLGDVPWRSRMTRIVGFTEAEADQMEQELEEDALRARRTAVQPPEPAAAPGDVSGG